MNRRHTLRHEELLPAYALGALEGEELQELEAHLDSGCEECRGQLAAWRDSLEELAASVPPVAPSAAVRERLQRLAVAGGTRSLTRWRAWAGTAAALAAACLLLAAGLGWRLARTGEESERLRAERDRLARQVNGLDRQLGLARSDARKLAEALAMITAPGARSVQLAGLPASPGASGRAFVEAAGGRALFYAHGLPDLPRDRIYQLWWIGGQGPVPAGTFRVNEQGAATLQVEDVSPPEQIQAWAVTVEPAGGVPQPTGEMVLKG